MKASLTVSGALMRRFRAHSKLSLRVASERLRLSIAVLSRIERGIRMPSRAELTAMIEVYALSPWEAHSLLVSAGFMPELPLARELDDEMDQWEAHLKQTPYPAYVMDSDGFIIMWNALLQTMWPLNQSNMTHIVEWAYSAEARQVLGAEWPKQALAATWNYYLYTISSPQARTDTSVLLRLATHLGSEFIQGWNEAISRGYADAHTTVKENIGTEITYRTRAGDMRFLVTRVGTRPATANSLFLWLPADAQSLALHQQMMRTASHEVYRVASK